MGIPEHDTLDIKIYYEDTDALGIVYYANYLKYFERARTELFDKTELSIADWNRAGAYFAVHKANLTFLGSARLGDLCQVRTTRLPHRTPYRLKFHQELWLHDKVITKAEIDLVCLTPTLEVREFPAELLLSPTSNET